MTMTRRTMLQRGAAAGLVLAAPRFLIHSTPTAAAAVAPFTQPLKFAPVLTGADITIPIHPADVPILPGAPTRMWTFGGTFPGPTIRRPAGATTRVTFEHRAFEAGRLTIHNHGHHSASVHDGQPHGAFLSPGRSRTYVYEHVEDGHPLRGALRWYHDHSHGRTGRNSWMGLLGFFVIDNAAQEAGLGLPGTDRELLLVVTERSFDERNQLADPFAEAADPGADGVGVGEVILVNGVPQPYVEVEPARYRLRILNAASFTPYNVGLGGLPLTQIGTESGLLPAPIERERVLLGPAERCDLVVDFSERAGNNIVLSSMPQDPRSAPWSALAPALAKRALLMQFRVRGAVRDTSAPAPALLPLPGWVADLPQLPDRVLAFGRGLDPADPSATQVWTINGTPYDPDTVVAKPELGSVETWLLINVTTQSHYIHLHDVDWKVVSRNGAAPDVGEDALKETFRLDPGDVVAVGTKFTDHLGTYMVHCHMFSHEDHAMMAPFEVVEPGTGDRPLKALDSLTAEEAGRVRRMLAAQRRRPGRPAPVPRAPIRLDRGSAALLCLLNGNKKRTKR